MESEGDPTREGMGRDGGRRNGRGKGEEGEERERGRKKGKKGRGDSGLTTRGHPKNWRP
jgi:hypothetical protein